MIFESAIHVSGDKLSHLQEHFLTVYTDFGTMNRYCCRPVIRLRWSSVGSNIGGLYKKLYIQSKSAPEDGRVCRSKHVKQIQISSIKRSINENCCFLLFADIIELSKFNPSDAELNRICHLLPLLGSHHILHVSRIRVKLQFLLIT